MVKIDEFERSFMIEYFYLKNNFDAKVSVNFLTDAKTTFYYFLVKSRIKGKFNFE